MHNSWLLSLLQLSDPTLPIGGFSHSAGLETYVQQGIVSNAASAKNFISNMLSQNLYYTDAALVSLAYDAACSNDFDAIIKLDEECHAVKLPREIREASQKLGLRLLKIFEPISAHFLAIKFKATIHASKANGHYCIAYGLLSAAFEIPKTQALTAFYYNAAIGMITNCVKLVPLGQQDGQQILFCLHPLLEQLAERSLKPDHDLIGLCCPGFDIRCMQHEQLYSRLYMS